MDLAKYRVLFVTEAREHLDGISRDLLTLEKNPADRAALDNLFRHAHSIKGMAASMGYEPIAGMSHKLEDLADMARRGVPFDQETVEIWLEGTDWLNDVVGLVEAGKEAEVQTPPLMQRVLQKAAAMVAAAPPKQGAVLPVVAASTPPPLPAPATPPAQAPGSRTEPGMTAVAPPAPTPPAAPPPTAALAALGPMPAVDAPSRASATLVLPAVAAPPGRPVATMMMQAVGPQEWTVEVTIAEAAATPHVRAFVVHKRVTEKLEVLDVTPPLADLKRGVLPDRVLKLRVKGTLDASAIRSLVMSLPDVTACNVLGAAAPPPPSASATRMQAVEAAAPAQRTVRVRTELLDELIDSVGEILLARSRLRVVAGRREDPELNELADEFARLAQTLHERVMGARMTPVSILADRFPRVVRDLARKRGREVNFVVEGSEIEMDRAILDELHDPVLHLVRNAVDHAHEGNDGRMARGRPATMTLTLSASRDRDHVLITLRDDGKGMSAEKLRIAAVEKGLMRLDQARALSDQAALEIICLPGFSTAEEVNDTSGRGVGMDAVRSTVEHLGGQLLIESEVGVGTTFTLRLPLTVAIIRVLLVRAGHRGAVYALPLHRVDHALDYAAHDVVRSQQDALYPVGDTLAPLHDLGSLLGYGVPEDPSGTVVVLEDPYRPLAVRVDGIMGQQEVVVKPLGEPLGSVPFLAGAALLADGSPTYILDVAKLVAGHQARAPDQERA